VRLAEVFRNRQGIDRIKGTLASIETFLTLDFNVVRKSAAAFASSIDIEARHTNVMVHKSPAFGARS